MASDTGVMNDKYGVAKAGGDFIEMAADMAPAFRGDFVCWGKDADGNVQKIWEAPWQNVVVDQGRALILNKVFASGFANHTNCFLFLHSATTASGNTWGNISASQVVSYASGAQSSQIPRLTFATSQTDSNVGLNSMSATASYNFTASTQTVSGAGILFYTATTMSTNFATSDGRLYCYGAFNGGSQLVQNGNTLSVTVTVSYNSTT